MTKSHNELLSTPQNVSQLADQKTRRNWKYEQLLASNVVTTNQILNSGIQKINNNSYTIGPGEHAGIIADIPNSDYIGTAGTIISASVTTRNIQFPFGPANPSRMGSLTVTADSKFSNMIFAGVVMVGSFTLSTASITAIFHNCTFQGPVQVQGSAHFIGCIFNYLDGASVISMGGNPVFVLGCSNKGGAFAGIPAGNQFGVTT